MNVHSEPDLLKKVEALALCHDLSESALIEAIVASFLSADASERLEAVFTRRMGKLGRQVEGLGRGSRHSSARRSRYSSASG